MYTGLTIADKPILERAKSRGATSFGFPAYRNLFVNVDAALAQIAEMEAERKPMTWNERINQMTVEEKVEWLNGSDYCRVTEIPIFECDAYKDCKECMRAFLNSPYTEGETDEG